MVAGQDADVVREFVALHAGSVGASAGGGSGEGAAVDVRDVGVPEFDEVVEHSADAVRVGRVHGADTGAGCAAADGHGGHLLADGRKLLGGERGAEQDQAFAAVSERSDSTTWCSSRVGAVAANRMS